MLPHIHASLAAASSDWNNSTSRHMFTQWMVDSKVDSEMLMLRCAPLQGSKLRSNGRDQNQTSQSLWLLLLVTSKTHRPVDGSSLEHNLPIPKSIDASSHRKTSTDSALNVRNQTLRVSWSLFFPATYMKLIANSFFFRQFQSRFIAPSFFDQKDSKELVMFAYQTAISKQRPSDPWSFVRISGFIRKGFGMREMFSVSVSKPVVHGTMILRLRDDSKSRYQLPMTTCSSRASHGQKLEIRWFAYHSFASRPSQTSSSNSYVRLTPFPLH